MEGTQGYAYGPAEKEQHNEPKESPHYAIAVHLLKPSDIKKKKLTLVANVYRNI